MARKEYVCLSCDVHFTIKYDGDAQLTVCPFCGEEFDQSESNEFDDSE